MKKNFGSAKNSAVSRLLLYLLLFINFSLLLNAGSPFSEEKNIASIPVDNEYIQTFRGRIGRWTIYQKKTIDEAIRNLGASRDEVLSLNGVFPGDGGYVFIPMSEFVYNDLLASGFGRRIVEVDNRKMAWPVEGPSYSSRYGHRRHGMHMGLDMACARGTVVVAARDGIVQFAKTMGGMGRAINVLHDDGLETWYGHNSVLLVNEGEKVSRGQIIALSGNTGMSTGPHLHFEIRFNTVALDPEDFLPYGIRNPDLVLRETPGTGFGIVSESALLLDRSRTTIP